MTPSLDLHLEELEDIEAPLTDMEWGLLAGAAAAGAFLLIAT